MNMRIHVTKEYLTRLHFSPCQVCCILTMNAKKKYHFFNKHQEVGLPVLADSDSDYNGQGQGSEGHDSEELKYRDDLYNCPPSPSSQSGQYHPEDLSSSNFSTGLGIVDGGSCPCSDEDHYRCQTSLTEGYPHHLFPCLSPTSNTTWAPDASETDGDASTLARLDEDNTSKEKAKRTPRYCLFCEVHFCFSFFFLFLPPLCSTDSP